MGKQGDVGRSAARHHSSLISPLLLSEFQMAETTCQPQFEPPHHLEWLIRRLSASSAWARMRFFAGRGSVLAQEGPAELISPPKILLAISTATMVRMSTLVVLLRTSDRKLAFYAAIALKATELIIML